MAIKVLKLINKEDLESIKKSIETNEHDRDIIIKTSREVVKLSKKVIYAVHRNDLDSAEIAIKEMESKLEKLKNTAKTPKSLNSGSFKVAVQEYVEALSFYELMKNDSIPTNSKLGLDPEFYLMGLIDLTGELVRKAINSAIKEDYGIAVKLKNLVTELYDELLLFDFAGGELRKKFDSVKYDLKKLDDLVINLKIGNKI